MKSECEAEVPGAESEPVRDQGLPITAARFSAQAGACGMKTTAVLAGVLGFCAWGCVNFAAALSRTPLRHTRRSISARPTNSLRLNSSSRRRPRSQRTGLHPGAFDPAGGQRCKGAAFTARPVRHVECFQWGPGPRPVTPRHLLGSRHRADQRKGARALFLRVVLLPWSLESERGQGTNNVSSAKPNPLCRCRASGSRSTPPANP